MKRIIALVLIMASVLSLCACGDEGGVKAYEKGMKYANGDGVEQDYTKALEYYNKAAEAGNADAMFEIGQIYYYGYGVEQDYSKALEYYTKATKAGNINAMLNAGKMLYDGKGVKQDYARETLNKSARIATEA